MLSRRTKAAFYSVAGRNDSGWFINFPENRQSIGGRFENFIFCRQEPQLFQECLSKEWESAFENPHTLVVEAAKPRL
jgi:hypothetical protein